ncbi:disease resistance protein At4g27190-like [Camellia sinensis]|uniref:disease resistance protein At4g27190-like n=1 Tax=Camellia sinensis TaxID=4442 RepID=UPI001035BDEB|nr:disease resistance protein At4g27190-like [Camellia sinensis]
MTDKLPHSRGKESSEIILLAGKEFEDAPLLFFHDMSALHVLDLSYTSVNSSPQSISKLNALQKLILRDCDFLIELPPEIGELTNLERVSISNLSRLNELRIDVNPDGDWWDVEVKTIIHDLCSLRELRTLELYLPTIELLEELIQNSPLLICPALTHFRFIVGHQVERFLSRLPLEVEEEFNNLEKSEKGLKYVNGEEIPIEIIEEIVKEMIVMNLNSTHILMRKKWYFGSLQYLSIHYMKNMESICQGSVGKGCLSSLKFLAWHTCLSLTTVFTVGMLRNLSNLEELIVENCTRISNLVGLKYSDSKSGHFLPNLKKILLLELPKLVSISNGLCIAPKLERIFIFFCPKLVKLSTMKVSSKDLKVIKGENEWWGALKWHESDLSSDHQDYLASVFVPLRRDGDLMAQFTKD